MSTWSVAVRLRSSEDTEIANWCPPRRSPWLSALSSSQRSISRCMAGVSPGAGTICSQKPIFSSLHFAWSW